MRTFLSLFTLCVISINISQAQEQSQPETLIENSDDRSFSLDYYFGVGLLYTDALDINPFLSESNVPTVRRFPVELSVGMTGSFGKNTIDFEFGFYNQERDDNGFGHKMNSTQLTLRYLRRVVKFENNNQLFVGSGLMLGTKDLEFFDENDSVDLNDPGSFGDVAKLDNSQFYISPSLGYSIHSSDDNEEYLRFQLSYELNLTSNDWESDYARVNNSFEETGNRWRLQVIFPF
ncbi:hypothetical protein [Psychroflexus tropicus]|uniref:hypothetical protein n=1 Tax=Psychroflexus tropicus TaxID=197345 RepID=UPI000364080E|nr:hypothetical protein [Psychroflexus tropicus]